MEWKFRVSERKKVEIGLVGWLLRSNVSWSSTGKEVANEEFSAVTESGLEYGVSASKRRFLTSNFGFNFDRKM